MALLALLGAGGFFLLWGVASFPPSEQSFYPRCQLHSLTGLHCPGCGMTRSLHAALNGQFSQAVAYNLLAPFVIPFLFLAAARSLWAWARDIPERPRPARFNLRWVPYVLGVVLVTFALTRNLPWHPFTLLAPHELERPAAADPPSPP